MRISAVFTLFRAITLHVIMASASLGLMAQNSVGSWTNIYSYGGNPADIIDTGAKVYVASVSSLMCYDRTSDEYDVLLNGTGLNDAHIQNIHYDYDSKKLLVAYVNGNMDIVLEDGSVVNMPEIKEMTSTTNKSLNNVVFRESRMYMAWDFGMIIVDLNRYCIVESLITSTGLTTVRPLGQYLLIGDRDQNMYTARLEAPHYSLEQFDHVGSCGLDYTTECDSMSIYVRSWINLVKMTFSDDAKSWSIDWNKMIATNITGPLRQLPDGRTITNTDTEMVVIERNDNTTRTPLPQQLRGKLFSTANPETDLWIADRSGLSSYAIDDNKTLTLSRQPYRPEGLSTPSVGAIVQDGYGIYFASRPVNNHDDVPYATESFIDRLSDGKFTSYMPDSIPHSSSVMSPADILHASYWMTPDVHNPGSLLVANYFDGIFRFGPDGNITGHYDQDNSSIYRNGVWCTNVTDVKFDNRGNLWATSAVWPTNGKYYHGLNYLPAAKCKQPTTTVDDWKGIQLEGMKQEMDTRILPTASGVVIVVSSDHLAAYDTKGTDATSDDSYRIYTSFTDQDGLIMELTGMAPMIEDKNGRVWIGHDMGVFEITSPKTLMNNTFTATRLKIPRNDGTNYADYLLDGIQVTCMAIDGANRKWIGTRNSGLYLVSENGNEILEHFTALNSDLTSDFICAVHCDLNSNRVYVGTDIGLSVYTSDAAPVHDDFSEVYAYPNPVRPEYTGWITVAGLMENSLVKIADAAGNVFFSGRSEGGMITWNGCNASGERVRTGVYFVMASSGPSATNSGIVAKILVVN